MSLFHCIRQASVVKPNPCRLLIQFYSKQTPRLAPGRAKKSFLGDGGYAMLMFPVTAFCLGTWQIKRREEKLKKIQLLEEKTSSPAIPLPDTLEEMEGLEYRTVIVRGTFDYSKEMVIRPRHDMHAVLGTPGNMQSTSNVGGYIVVPFKLSDSDRTILVNRGFVSQKNFLVDTRSAGQIEGEIELSGVVRKSESKNAFMPKSVRDPVKMGYWMYRDIELMSKLAGTEPIFLDAEYKSTVPGGPIGGQTRVQLRNEHLNYIFIWYSLSLITFFMWRKQYYKKTLPNRTMN